MCRDMLHLKVRYCLPNLLHFLAGCRQACLAIMSKLAWQQQPLCLNPAAHARTLKPHKFCVLSETQICILGRPQGACSMVMMSVCSAEHGLWLPTWLAGLAQRSMACNACAWCLALLPNNANPKPRSRFYLLVSWSPDSLPGSLDLLGCWLGLLESSYTCTSTCKLLSCYSAHEALCVMVFAINAAH